MAPPPPRGGGGERREPEGAELSFLAYRAELPPIPRPLVGSHAPSTMLRMVPLPRGAGEEPAVRFCAKSLAGESFSLAAAH
jgi:hypothetical protein